MLILIVMVPLLVSAASPVKAQTSWPDRPFSFSSFASGAGAQPTAEQESARPESQREPELIRETVYRPVDFSSPAEDVRHVSAISADFPVAGSVRPAAFDAAEGELLPTSHADLLPVPADQPPVTSSVPFFQLSPGDVPAGDSAATSGIASATGTETLIRGAAWLIVLMCLACLAILGLRRWQRQHGLLPATGGRSRVVDTLSLGPGRTVSLIEMNGLRALVGADAGGIRTIVLAPSMFEEEVRLAADDDTLQPPIL